MDWLAQIFNAMPLASGLFLDAHFTAPWSVSAKVGPEDCGQFVPAPGTIIAFHYVYAGELSLRMPDGHTDRVKAGEVIILPRNDPHVLASDPGLSPISAVDVVQVDEDGGPARIRHGGGGPATRLICGFLGCERRYEPVLSMLPATLKLALPDPVSANWFDSSFKLAARERMFRDQGGRLAKLTELLFLDAVQHCIRSAPPETFAWFGALSDSKVLNALSMMHKKLRYHWSTEELARNVGMSRSAFAGKFSELMGMPPMRYLALQRLQQASQRLQETNEPLVVIAFDAGYESEAAFSRAFKKDYGLPPATWRDHQQRQGKS
ncbi:MAG: AraC family transcriptional regulator [Azoarcus sp.]|nr:AraC family transcriptional regulator [Azoarcus sp.]